MADKKWAAGLEFGAATMPMTDGLKQLAMLYEAQGNFSGADPFYLRALEMEEASLGPEHPDMLQSL